MINPKLSKATLYSNHSANNLQSRSKSPFVPLITLYKEQQSSRNLYYISNPNLLDRCQTPPKNTTRADPKGRPYLVKKIKKPEQPSKVSTKRSKLKVRKSKYNAYLYIEHLITVPISERKKPEISIKRTPRVCCAEKRELYNILNKPKETMTESFDESSFMSSYLLSIADKSF